MTIKEVEEATGLSRSHIRFYEKEGFLNPERNVANRYRQYSDQDVETIRKVALLRSMEVPLEEIRALTEGKKTLEQVLKAQRGKLLEEAERLRQARQLCDRMLKDGEISYETLSVETYVPSFASYMKEQGGRIRVDMVSFWQFWGGTVVWVVLTALCLTAAALFFPALPQEIPVQWSGGVPVSYAGRAVIFLYPAACVILRFFLRPFIWNFLRKNGFLGDLDGISDGIVNAACLVAFSCLLFSAGAVNSLPAALAADAAVLILFAAGKRRFAGRRQKNG